MGGACNGGFLYDVLEDDLGSSATASEEGACAGVVVAVLSSSLSPFLEILSRNLGAPSRKA